MRGWARWVACGAAAAMLAGMAGDAEGQRRRAKSSRGNVGISFVAADPQGEMGLLVDEGFGAQIHGSHAIEPSGHLRLRADAGFLVYGYERQRICYGTPVGCRIEVDLNTTNAIAYGGAGPELVLAQGPVEPYAYASFGFSYFATTSSLRGESDYEEYASTTNFSDAVYAWRAGGGLRVRVAGGRTPVAIDVALEHHDNGVVEYLTEGDIVDEPDGSVTLFPTRSEANLVTLRLGLTVGLPRWGRHR